MMRSVVCIVGAALVFAACGGHDKAGGAAVARAPTIEIATQNGSPHYLSAYVRALGRDTAAPTHMTVRTSVRAAEVNGEAAIVRDVSAGRIDFALVSARVLDTLGVDALQPLLAPVTIDSLEVEQRVLAGDLPKRMLPALAKLGVVGVTLLPGDLRHPLGITRRLARPADFAGATVGIRRSTLPRRVFEQLGASVVLNRGESYPGVDGIEADLTIIEGEEADVGAESLAADLALWPRIFVVIANPDAWDGLDPQRRRALRDGGRIALPTAIDILRGRDAEAYGVLCRRGEVAFVQTTPDDANAFRRALAPVTRTLDTAALAEIARVRAAVGPPPTHPRCHRPARIRPGPETAIDGVWEFTSDADDLRAMGLQDSEVIPDNWGHFVLAFSRGRFTITNESDEACGWVYGTYQVNGQRMTWQVTDGRGEEAANRPGERFVYAWSRFKDTLRVTSVPGEISPENYVARPWRQIGDDPKRAPFSPRCPPPGDAQF